MGLLKKISLLVLVVISLAVVSHLYFSVQGEKLNKEKLGKFAVDPDCEAYKIAFPQFSLEGKKVPKAVLLLHGFGESPQGFEFLIKELKQRKIPYYAPLQTGFGLTNLHLLNVAKSTDWLRDAIFGYDLLSSVANEVVVVGHSNGGCDGIVLSSLKQVPRLILIDPYVYPDLKHNKTLKLFMPILKSKLATDFFSFIIPTVHGQRPPTDLTDNQLRNHLTYRVISTHSIRSLVLGQEKAQQTLEQFNHQTSSKALFAPKHIYVLYGEKDTIADMPRLVSYLKDFSIPCSFKSYPRSGHDLLFDYDYKEAVNAIVNIIENKDFSFK